MDFLSYSLNVLRATDRDRYISVLFAPKKERRALAAVYTFNAEISRIGEDVHEPLIGEMRLRWWYNSIASGEGKDSNPILNDLLEAITSFNLPKEVFLHYCDARVSELYSNPIATTCDLEIYCEKTAGSILYLACQILNFKLAQDFTDVCRHASIAQASSGILRLLSLGQSRYRNYFPSDLLKATGVDREELESDHVDDTQKKRIIEAMVALSRDHYLKFLEHSTILPKTLKLAFLPLAITPASLQKVTKLGAKIFQENAVLSPLHRYWLVTKTAIGGHFPQL
ncbi:Phytoene synthase [Bartonella ancashensis]|uniref:Phytoene synthase n=2 Tax=Bartonella ancashensis TaxID=1318743 RepID=A0A0M4LTJ5_9HYPH|nr:Phytoene synthase [Bartonella ancashensis]